jgi:hypothetical protein
MFVIQQIILIVHLSVYAELISKTNNSDSCFPQGFMWNTPEGGLVAAHTK